MKCEGPVETYTDEYDDDGRLVSVRKGSRRCRCNGRYRMLTGEILCRFHAIPIALRLAEEMGKMVDFYPEREVRNKISCRPRPWNPGRSAVAHLTRCGGFPLEVDA